MKKLSLIFSVIAAINCPAQDSLVPFKYIGQGNWQTKTEFVRRYDLDLAKLIFYDSVYVELEKQNNIYVQILDSLRDEIELYKKIMQAKDMVISDKQEYISRLEKPQEIKGNFKSASNSIFNYEGIFFNLGAFTKFDNLNTSGEKILKGVRFFGSLEAGCLFFDKFKFNMEVIIPPEIKLKGGIRL